MAVPRGILEVGAALFLCASIAPRAWAGDDADLTAIGFESLLNLEVSTVSRSPERWSGAGAAVFVITADDIRRSGVTSIPEALRLAPGVHVARIDGNKWSIGVRGFGSRLSRSLLVLIDGRSVYSPLFAGVYWEVQDTLLHDVDRIEVVRGPGGTLWGANAVNGVINIITKPAAATLGGLASAGAGSEDRGFSSFRVGRAVGESLQYRVYAKVFDRDGGFHAAGAEYDEWWMGQGGFRAEWQPAPADRVTVQGGYYGGRAGQTVQFSTFAAPYTTLAVEDASLSGGHLHGTWDHRTTPASASRTRFYYDRTERREPHFEETRDTFDVDFQQEIGPLRRHEIVWGAGYRVTADRTSGVETIEFLPASRTDGLASAFLQDSIALVPAKLRLTVGAKVEHNAYSGVEVQPAVGVVWTPTPSSTLWGRVARAVRTPSRIEHDLRFTSLVEPSTPTFTRLEGDDRFTSEVLTAAEIGYRGEPGARLFLAATVFVNRYDDLLSLEPGAPFTETTPPPDHTVIPLSMRNHLHGTGRGAELILERRFRGRWRAAFSYSFLDLSLRTAPGSADTTSVPRTEGSSPRHQGYVRTSVNLPRGFEVDTFLRFVDDLPAQEVKSYAEADLALHWLFRPGLRVSLVGQNLLHRHHVEAGGSAPTQAERALSLRLSGRW